MASWSCGEDFLLDTAVLSVGVFEAQTQFRFVVFQVEQLLGVKSSTTLPVKKVRFQSKQQGTQNNNSVLSFHTDDTEHNVWRTKTLTVGWSAQHPHIPSHTRAEPGPPTQELWRQTATRGNCATATRRRINVFPLSLVCLTEDWQKYHKALVSQILCHSKTHKLWSHVINTAC